MSDKVKPLVDQPSVGWSFPIGCCAFKMNQHKMMEAEDRSMTQSDCVSAPRSDALSSSVKSAKLLIKQTRTSISTVSSSTAQWDRLSG